MRSKVETPSSLADVALSPYRTEEPLPFLLPVGALLVFHVKREESNLRASLLKAPYIVPYGI